MTSRKYNEFLDANDSESDESEGHNSDNDNTKKGGSISRRKNIESYYSEDEDGGPESSASEADKKEPKVFEEKLQSTSDCISSKDFRDELPGVSKPLLKKNLVSTTIAIKRSGVVYLSRIPPYMKPTKLRSLLEPYGSINRIFLTPEDPASHTRRIRHGGNKKRSFVDGWVEFVNKADAKAACELLNARNIGGKKGTYYHDDVWNLIYLKGFKWINLTEQIATENAERASRMRAEISKTTKENKEFLKNVERAKMLDGIESKRAAKRRKQLRGEDILGVKNSDFITKKAERPKTFEQKTLATKNSSKVQSEQVERVLRKIF